MRHQKILGIIGVLMCLAPGCDDSSLVIQEGG